MPRRGRERGPYTSTMSDDPAAETKAPTAAYRVLARTYRPATFADLIGQEPLVRTLSNAIQSGRVAHAFVLTGVRGVGKTTTGADSGARAQLHRPRRPGRPDRRSLRGLRALPGHRRGSSRRRHGDGRRQPHRHRRHPRDHRGRALSPDLGAQQDLHHRRGPHALPAGLQRPAEDARGAARARRLHLRDDRDPQGPRDRALALPALRPEARRERRAEAAISRASPSARASRSRQRPWR